MYMYYVYTLTHMYVYTHTFASTHMRKYCIFSHEHLLTSTFVASSAGCLPQSEVAFEEVEPVHIYTYECVCVCMRDE